jgi:transposase
LGGRCCAASDPPVARPRGDRRAYGRTSAAILDGRPLGRAAGPRPDPPALQYAIDAGEAAFAPALRRRLCWVVAVGRRRADLKDTTLAQYRAAAERRLDRLIAMPVTTAAGAALRRQTKRWRSQFFTFITDRQVPPTNNSAERALRPSVVFRKVTNRFRSLWGADVHALT